MSDSRERILDRIKKLLALAGNNSSEAERDSAMAKVQQLVIQYDIDMREVGTSVNDEVKVAEWTQVTRSGQWARRTAAAIGRLYFCGYVYTSLGKKMMHHFIGTETHGKIAAEVANFVIEGMYHEGARQMRMRGATNAYWTAFVNSASIRIAHRVRDLVQEAQQPSAEVSSSRALVVVDMYAQAQRDAEAYMANMKLKQAVTRPMQNKSAEGWRAGQEYGDKVNLNLTVQGATVKQGRIK